MDLRAFSVVFATVFVAELGDKTQLATLLFASDKAVNKWVVFAASSLALVCAAGLGVLAGAVISRYVNERQLGIVAGLGFVAIGGWTLYRAVKG